MRRFPAGCLVTLLGKRGVCRINFICPALTFEGSSERHFANTQHDLSVCHWYRRTVLGLREGGQLSYPFFIEHNSALRPTLRIFVALGLSGRKQNAK